MSSFVSKLLPHKKKKNADEIPPTVLRQAPDGGAEVSSSSVSSRTGHRYMKHVRQHHPLEVPKNPPPPRPASLRLVVEHSSPSHKKLSRSSTLNNPTQTIEPSVRSPPEDAVEIRPKKPSTRKLRPVTVASAHSQPPSMTTPPSANDPPTLNNPKNQQPTIQLSDLIVCAICLDQLRRPTMVRGLYPSCFVFFKVIK